MKRTVAVFARAPVAGQVKTRLARHLGEEAARALYAAMLRDTLALAKRAARNLDCEVVVAHTPPQAFDPGPDSLADFWKGARMAQCEGDIGARMLDCIAKLQQEAGQVGAHVVLIGSDAPELPPSFISQAFARLAQASWVRDDGFGKPDLNAQSRPHDLVFGPALDGGFYLLGASIAVPPALFFGVEWSARNTLAQVEANAARLDLRCALLQRLGDIDTGEDLQRFSQRGMSRKQRARAPHTMRCLRALKIGFD